MKKYILLSLIILPALMLSGCGEKSYEEEPFFSGTKLLMVCKRPYYDATQCYATNVTNNSDTMTIRFNNGGSITLNDIYCTKTINNDDLCQGVDSEGNTWDILEPGADVN